MVVDPVILAGFGPPPSGLDLSASNVSVNNGAVIAMLCLASVAVILRFTARIILRNALMYDDWAIIAALIFIGATTGISIAGGNVGSGRHIWAVSVEDLMALYRLLFSYTFLYASSCTCIRISILFFYKRIFSPLEPSMKIILAVAGFITLSYPIIIWVTMATSCKPVSFFWTQFSGTQGTCINITSFFLALGIINMLNDFFLLTLPFPRFIKLQMTVRKKVAICGIMAVGAFVCVASIVRIYYLRKFMSTADVTWLMGPVFIWSTIEPSVGVVCACLPHFAPLARIAHRSISSGYHSRQATGGQSENRQWPSHKYNSKQYASNRMNKGTDDDEIGLTNYVTTGVGDGYKQLSEENVARITVQSTFKQDSKAKESP
ncbi:hypothetical protein BDV18DRAFT_155812 [Aspergillus unguis]